MSKLEIKMVKYIRLSKQIHDLQIKKITEKKYKEEWDKLTPMLEHLGKDIIKELEDISEEVEKSKIFFKNISDPYYRHTPWYSIVEYVEKGSKYTPNVVYDYVSKILEKEKEEEKEIMKFLEKYK